MRPERIVVVAGTDTEVGKTWVAAELARRLRGKNLQVSARKPGQSFSPGQLPTDAEVLGAATGEASDDVCPPHRWYPLAMAPPMAASALGHPVPNLASLVEEVSSKWPLGVDIGLVEGAGGVASPLASDGHTADLARAIGADLVILVARAGLGTINAVRLSAAALAPIPVIVYLNRFDSADDLHLRNRDWLDQIDGHHVAINIEALVTQVARSS